MTHPTGIALPRRGVRTVLRYQARGGGLWGCGGCAGEAVAYCGEQLGFGEGFFQQGDVGVEGAL